MGGDNFNKSGVSFDSELLSGYYNILNGEVREDWQQVVDAQLDSLIAKWWYNVEDYVILKITSTSIHAEEHVFENPSVEILNRIWQADYDKKKGFAKKINLLLKTKVPGLSLSDDFERFYFSSYFFINSTPKLGVSNLSTKEIIEKLNLTSTEANEPACIYWWLGRESSACLVNALEELIGIFEEWFPLFEKFIINEIQKGINEPFDGMNSIINKTVNSLENAMLIRQLNTVPGRNSKGHIKSKLDNFLNKTWKQAQDKFRPLIIEESRYTALSRPFGDSYKRQYPLNDSTLIPLFSKYLNLKLTDLIIVINRKFDQKRRHWTGNFDYVINLKKR